MRRLATTLVLLAATAAPALADCRGEVAAAFEKQRQAKAFRMSTVQVTEQGPMSMTVDYVLPNRMHQTVKFIAKQVQLETILVGLRAWVNEGQGWKELPSDDVAPIIDQVRESVAQPPKDLSNYICDGRTKLDGREYIAYRADDTSKKVEPGKNVPDAPVRMLFVDAETGLPARSVVTAKNIPNRPIFRATFTYPTDLSIEPPTGK